MDFNYEIQNFCNAEKRINSAINYLENLSSYVSTINSYAYRLGSDSSSKASSCKSKLKTINESINSLKTNMNKLKDQLSKFDPSFDEVYNFYLVSTTDDDYSFADQKSIPEEQNFNQSETNNGKQQGSKLLGLLTGFIKDPIGTCAKVGSGVKSYIKDKFPSSELEKTGAKISSGFTSLFEKAKDGFGVLISKGNDIVKTLADEYEKNKQKKAEEKAIKEAEEEAAKNKKFTYKDLFDTSSDEKKFFGKDTTLGRNGEKITFDSVNTYGDSKSYYYKGKHIKTVTDEYVEFHDGNVTWRINKDGSYMFYDRDTFEKIYYSKEGIESKRAWGDNSEGLMSWNSKSFDENGNVIEEINGVDTYQYENGILKRKITGKNFEEYDSDGNVIAVGDEDTYTKVKADGTKEIYNTTNNQLIEKTDESGVSTKYLGGGKIKEIDNGNDGYDLYDENGKLRVRSNGYDLTFYDENGKVIPTDIVKKVDPDDFGYVTGTNRTGYSHLVNHSRTILNSDGTWTKYDIGEIDCEGFVSSDGSIKVKHYKDGI